MFVRFRRTGRRLYVSLVAPHRTGSTVNPSHLIGLGSLPQEWTADTRRVFWDRLYQKLAPPDCAQRALILEAIHARIPKLTPTEMQAEQAQRLAAELQRLATGEGGLLLRWPPTPLWLCAREVLVLGEPGAPV
jgi:hypothetical protein